MTWGQLLLLLQDMSKVNHTAMDKAVTVIIDQEEWYLDLAESLSTGEVVFVSPFGSGENGQ